MSNIRTYLAVAGHASWKEIRLFSEFVYVYAKKKVLTASRVFEKNKNYLVKFFLMKRGRYARPFLHITTMSVLGIGIFIAPYLAETYPILTGNAPSSLSANAAPIQESIEVSDSVFQTDKSSNLRSKVVTYTVERGDTMSSIAKKFSSPGNEISVDSIKWANDVTTDDVTVGDQLQIPPVTGIVHKVAKGETVYTIAEKYGTDAQKIVDFPFNDFANPETFSLVDGQLLIVPDGIKPSEKPVIRAQQKQYIARDTDIPAVGGGGMVFPLPGNTGISQYASWYHMALDITAPLGTPIYAAQNATVSVVSIGGWDGGYGNNVWIDNGAGVATHYCHMQAANVSVGQRTVAGQTIIGWVGLTGRTTGAHLHFEVRANGTLVNPMGYLP
jgi:murein DD-endopeptidase MepM/ murein hydrolase activator NlpD